MQLPLHNNITALHTNCHIFMVLETLFWQVCHTYEIGPKLHEIYMSINRGNGTFEVEFFKFGSLLWRLGEKAKFQIHISKIT